jgi:hypothetical protein
MTLICKLERDDFKRAAWLHMKPRRGFAIIGSTLIILALGIIALELQKFFMHGDGLTTVLVLGAILVYFALYFFVWIPHQMKKLFDQQKLAQTECQMEISDECLVSRASYGESKIPWPSFHKWKATSDMILLYQSDALYHVFPARMFPSPGDFKAFQSILAEHLGKPKV